METLTVRRCVELGLVLRVVVLQQFIVDRWSGVTFGVNVVLVLGGGRLMTVLRGGRLMTVLRRLWFNPLHLGPESVHVVSCVLDHSGGSVRLDEAISALDRPVPVAHLVLALLVPGQRVVHRVLEVICRPGLVVIAIVTMFHELRLRNVTMLLLLLLRVLMRLQWLEWKRRGYSARGHYQHRDVAAARHLKKRDKYNMGT